MHNLVGTYPSNYRQNYPRIDFHITHDNHVIQVHNTTLFNNRNKKYEILQKQYY